MRLLRAVLRHLRLVVLVLAVALAVTLVTTVTVDLGPVLKGRAEQFIAAWFERPTTIGRLGVQIARGRVVIEDLRIAGLLEGSEPWLVAGRIEASLTWGALLGREVLLDSIEMADWRMVAESYMDGRQSFPRVTGPPRPPRDGPSPVVTTLQFIHAHRGEFVYLDHGSDWSSIAPNLEITVTKLADYRGQIRYSGGTLTIQDYLPMTAALEGSFHFEGARLIFDALELRTDGARTTGTGVADLGQWPEQLWQLESRIQLPEMRPIFFKDDDFTLHGVGDFTGTFHMFSGGRRLEGEFRSAEAGVNDYRFPDVKGSLVWVPESMEVTRGTSRFYGGTTAFTYKMWPLNDDAQPTRSRFDVTYEGVDLTTFTNFLETRGMRLAGTARGRHLLEWPLGAFDALTGEGEVVVTPPADRPVLGRTLPADADIRAQQRAEQWGPFSAHRPLAPVALGGEARYRYDPEQIVFEPGHIATPETYIAYEGVTGWGERSRMPFHVTSADWQESHRFLAGIMTMFGSATNAVAVDGVGEFTGVLIGAFSDPRIEGTFDGREMRAWDVTWGRVRGESVIENLYAIVTGVVVERDHSRMFIDGQFALGYPRRDGGEEIDARIRVEERPIGDFQQSFDLEDYPITGAVSGDIHIYGPYEGPYGFGRVTIDRGVAYDEPFATASASLRFEGTGVRLDGIEALKGGGVITGAAWVGWNGAYSFNADGRRLALETLYIATFPDGPVFTGLVDFSASGSGVFEEPRYDVRVTARDVFVNDEGIGQVTARLAVRNILLTFEVEAASPRLAVSGTGRLALTDEGDAEMSFRVTDTSLDPYVRALAFRPDLSPYTTAVGSGTIRVTGELYNFDALRVDTTIEQLDLRFFDYQLRNASPIQVAMDRQVIEVNALRLVGDQTELDLVGTVDLVNETVSLTANGDANFAVLQGLVRDVRSAGRTEVAARIDGPMARPLVSGTALITDGRVRHFSAPHALEAVNGIVTFNTTGIRLDGITARLAGGDIRFGGRIGLNGLALGEFDVTATGEQMRLRFPEGMRSLIDATLSLQGPPDGLVLGGDVFVRSAVWTRGFDTPGNVFSLGGGDAGLGLDVGGGPGGTVPLSYDVQITAPSTLRIENDQARIVASADLELRGTYDRPLLFGRAEIERGEARFEGRRYIVTRGSLDFTNPVAIEPFFDVEAETRVRVPGQTYRVTLRMAGTTERMQPEFTSDPPLPPVEILTLLFSDSVPGGDVELASLRSPNQREQELLQARATRALTGALSAEVGRVVEQTFGVDTFQITPLLVDPYQQSSRLNVNPAARVTIGKRLSDRLFLTYARSLSSSTRDEIILLEYDQSDSLAWVFSQNEDRTYALEVRKRVSF
ncbi:MAG: translocation/assembly module TamB domain-containing protein [Vicinamibacterales bacterium]|nr:translocation/assembly module TamB domain-containing protein [Vicinamibacterales bacterium]